MKCNHFTCHSCPDSNVYPSTIEEFFETISGCQYFYWDSDLSLCFVWNGHHTVRIFNSALTEVDIFTSYPSVGEPSLDYIKRQIDIHRAYIREGK